MVGEDGGNLLVAAVASIRDTPSLHDASVNVNERA
jgi:hypothetical protein